MLNLNDDVCDSLLKILWEESITGLAILEKDGTFIRANSTFCRIVEYSEAELKRLRFQDITDPGDVRAGQEMAQMTADGTYPGFQMTKNYITKTRKVQPVLLRETALLVNGKFFYFVKEIAPIEPFEEKYHSAIEDRANRRIFFKWFVENWQLVAACVAGIAWIAAQTYSYFAR